MNKKIPEHVAIIMDGNGRWAVNRDLPRSEGHAAGVGTVKSVVKACLEKHIKVLSIWAFGSENWARPEIEVNFLMELFVKALAREVAELHEHNVCLRFTGNRAALAPALQEQMQAAEQLTQNNQRLVLNVVINYGGKWDIVQAVKSISGQIAQGTLSIEQIDEALVAEQLCMSDLPNPDLFIRTGGELRVSNFFLWQLAYTELYFSEVFWPDFTIEEFEKALISFGARERRYGRTSKQLVENSHV